MSIIEQFGRIAERVGSQISNRVGELVEDNLLTERHKSMLRKAEAAVEGGRYDAALIELDALEQAKPGLHRVKTLRGLVYLNQDRPLRAIHFFESALRDRESVSGYTSLALAYERAGRLSDARGALFAALGQDKESPLRFEIFSFLGRLELQTGRPERAQRHLERALKLRPGQQETVALLALSLHRLGFDAEALALLEPERDHLVENESRVLLAQLLLGAGRTAQARQLFSSIEPPSSVSLEGLCQAALAEGQLREAGAALMVRDQDDAPSARSHTLWGELGRARGDFLAAKASFEAALALQPDFVDAIRGAAQLALEQGEWQQAKGLLERLDALEPDQHLTAVGLARAYLHLDERTSAARAFADAEATGRSVELILAKAEQALLDDEPFAALVFLRHVERQYPQPLAPAAQALARHLESSANMKIQASSMPQLQVAALDSEDPEELRVLLTQLIDFFQGQVEAQGHLFASQQALTELERERATLDSPLTVALLGEFNAGKSTLLNAVLGEDLLPTGSLPTTGHLHLIKYGPRFERFVITQEAGEERRRRLAEGAPLVQDGDAILRYELFFPHPMLRAIHFLDTPGFNSANAEHEARARELLNQADAALWLMDINQAASHTQLTRLRKISGARHKLLLILNKDDTLDGAERDEVDAYVRRTLAEEVLGIHSCSGLRALNAQLEGQAPPSSWQGFFAEFEGAILGRTAALKAAECARHVGEIVSTLLRAAQQQAARLRAALNALTTLASDIAEHRAAMRQQTIPKSLEALQHRRELALTIGARDAGEQRTRQGGIFAPLSLDVAELELLFQSLSQRFAAAIERCYRQLTGPLTQFSDELVETLQWLLRPLPSQRRALQEGIAAFTLSERSLRGRLELGIFGALRADLEGRTQALCANNDFADRLGSEDLDEHERNRLLRFATPTLDTALREGLEAWTKEYFDLARQLCDNVQHTLELQALELEHCYFNPFESWPKGSLPQELTRETE